MSDTQSLNEVLLARQLLARLSDDNSILHPMSRVLNLIAHSSIGLGEVLQDYARQASIQLQEVMHAAQNISAAIATPEDWESLRNLHPVMKSAKTVLDMTPSAMRRNKADSIGEKEKISSSELERLTHSFNRSPDIARLLEREDSGETLVAFLMQENAGAMPLSLTVEGEAKQAGLRH